MAESNYTKKAWKNYKNRIEILKAVKKMKKIKPKGLKKPRNKTDKIWQQIKNKLIL